jgi:hypothetical protein
MSKASVLVRSPKLSRALLTVHGGVHVILLACRIIHSMRRDCKLDEQLYSRGILCQWATLHGKRQAVPVLCPRCRMHRPLRRCLLATDNDRWRRCRQRCSACNLLPACYLRYRRFGYCPVCFFFLFWYIRPARKTSSVSVFATK